MVWRCFPALRFPASLPFLCLAHLVLSSSAGKTVESSVVMEKKLSVVFLLLCITGIERGILNTGFLTWGTWDCFI